MKIIKYKTENLVNYYSKTRKCWNEFYESERYMFDKVLSRFGASFSLLDVGCGCGGLGNALLEKFPLNYYRGLDINEAEINWAVEHNKLSVPYEFICEDLAVYHDKNLFDVVISLGCVDYNIEVDKMIENAWNRVKPGGYFILSIRLTTEESINDIERAFQYLNYDDENAEEGEIANYVVFSLPDILKVFSGMNCVPANIEAYGYWCKHSKTAVIEYDELCMSVFALHKPQDCNIVNEEMKVQLELPRSFFAKM